MEIRTESNREQKRKVAEWTADPVLFVNSVCKTYDPRTDAKIVDFKLYPRQEQFLHWLSNLESRKVDGLCEKSRDTGITYLCAAYALHGWLFKRYQAVGFGSRKLEYVDRIGDPKCIFEKIRFMLYHLPEWVLDRCARGFKRDRHDNHARLLNPANHSTITGEGGDMIGRGDRTSLYFVDEAAFLEHPERVNQALIATTEVRIDVSTPNGPGNPFAVKRQKLPADRVFSYHWRDDPRKTEEWAEREKIESGATAFASEYDIDYSASIEGITIPGAWVRAAVGLDLGAVSGRNGQAARTVGGLDIAEEGANLSVFIPRTGPVVGTPVAWGQTNTTETAWRARDEALHHLCSELYYDSVGVGAGVRGTLDTAERALGFRAVAVNVGATPSKDDRWPDGQSSAEKFLNLKAELWWRLRTRFEKVYENSTGLAVERNGKLHPPEELISIPDCGPLVSQLSIPLHFRTESGRIRMESKDELRRRGIPSPDYAEALTLTEASSVLRPKTFWMK